MTLRLLHSELLYLIYEENLIFFFISVVYTPHTQSNQRNNVLCALGYQETTCVLFISVNEVTRELPLCLTLTRNVTQETCVLYVDIIPDVTRISCTSPTGLPGNLLC